jgi:hippurate hydrolase
VIPEYAEAEGSMRCFEKSTRDFIIKRLTEISENIGKAFRAEVSTEFYAGCPALVNDREISNLCQSGMKELLGVENVLIPSEADGRSMSAGSEDFAYIAEKVPSVMIALSAGCRADGYEYPLHNPKARFDLEAMKNGASAYAYFAINYTVIKWAAKVYKISLRQPKIFRNILFIALVSCQGEKEI